MPRLEALFDDETKCRYTLKYILQRPGKNEFSAYKLDETQQDDVLLASILQFKTTVNPSDDVILITNDYGPRLKAKSLGLSTIKPPDEYLLEQGEDEKEKEIDSLKRELSAIKNASPAIQLSFADKQSFLKVPGKDEIKTKEEFVAQELAKQQSEYKKLIFRESSPTDRPVIRLLSNPLFNLSEEQVSRYNNDLENYFKRYEDFAREQYDNLHFVFNTVTINFYCWNTGSSPANDIDIEFHFPDGFDVITDKDFPDKLKKPSPPYKPKNAWDFGRSTDFNLAPFFPHSIDLSKMNTPTDSSSPRIKKTNSYLVNFHKKVLKHNQHFILEPVYLKYADIKNAKGFAIDYKIIVANIPKMIEGKLHVQFES